MPPNLPDIPFVIQYKASDDTSVKTQPPNGRSGVQGQLTVNKAHVAIGNLQYDCIAEEPTERSDTRIDIQQGDIKYQHDWNTGIDRRPDGATSSRFSTTKLNDGVKLTFVFMLPPPIIESHDAPEYENYPYHCPKNAVFRYQFRDGFSDGAASSLVSKQLPAMPPRSYGGSDHLVEGTRHKTCWYKYEMDKNEFLSLLAAVADTRKDFMVELCAHNKAWHPSRPLIWRQRVHLGFSSFIPEEHAASVSIAGSGPFFWAGFK